MNSFEDNPIYVCPHCKLNEMVKYGKFRNRQRYKCKECNRTFTSFTNKPWSYTKKHLSFWEKYINIMNNNCLYDISNSLKINIASAFSWRHKLLTYFKENKSIKLNDNIGIQNRPIKENRKGSKLPYVPSKKLSLTIAIDSYNNYSLSTHYNGVTSRIINDFVNRNLNEKATILQSFNRYVIAVRKTFNINKTIHNTKIPNVCKYYNKFIYWIGKKFRGVATKNLKFYIGWFNNFALE